jgi:hypothetical protein
LFNYFSEQVIKVLLCLSSISTYIDIRKKLRIKVREIKKEIKKTPTLRAIKKKHLYSSLQGTHTTKDGRYALASQSKSV